MVMRACRRDDIKIKDEYSPSINRTIKSYSDNLIFTSKTDNSNQKNIEFEQTLENIKHDFMNRFKPIKEIKIVKWKIKQRFSSFQVKGC